MRIVQTFWTAGQDSLKHAFGIIIRENPSPSFDERRISLFVELKKNFLKKSSLLNVTFLTTLRLNGQIKAVLHLINEKNNEKDNI